ncbi:uncharacterized protein LOC123542238 [Mercenaria mercenaria]|uniref:uncharacterized protein LOC123542238 n=1 Tax=Mercenaria mercenaria TaxID=6596 RepID=UPI00234EDE75|nr:uncharacterized protein LOC123542238 [Mercenaria mercenaria]
MDIRTYLLILFIVTLVDIISHVQGSGSLYDPPNRAVMWKYGFHTQKNYNYMQLNCGGVKQHENGPFKCGVCGDPYNSTRPHEKNGRYGLGMISRYYPAGIKEMPVKVELLAFEKGFFEFRICSADNNEVTQECLDENILPIKEGYLAGTPLRFFPKGAGDFRLTVAIPPNMTCDRCVLQWRYHTANSWGTDPVTKEQGLGMGPQEEFRNCADIRIGGTIPNSVRDNPFFAPPDARPGSAIDKPTDQRKRLASQNGSISITSGGIHSASGEWKTSTTSEKRIQIPDVNHGGKRVSNKQTSSVKGQVTSGLSLMPIVSGTAGSGDLNQGSASMQQPIIHQNDINAKQLNGHFSLDNVLHDTSKNKQNVKQNTSSGTVDIIGHRKQIGSLHLEGAGSQMSSGPEIMVGMGSHLIQGSGGMTSHIRQDSASTGGTDRRMTQGSGSSVGMDSHMTSLSESTGGMGSHIRQHTDSTGIGAIRRMQGTGSILGMDSHMTSLSDSTGGADSQIRQHTSSAGGGFIRNSQIRQHTDSAGTGAIRKTQGTGSILGMDSHMTRLLDPTGGVDNQITQHTSSAGGGLIRKKQGTGSILGINSHTTSLSDSTGGVNSQVRQRTDSAGIGAIRKTQGTGSIKSSDSNLFGETRFTGHALNVGTGDSLSSGMTQNAQRTFDSVTSGTGDMNTFADRGMSIQLQGAHKEIESFLSGMSTDQIAGLIDRGQISHGMRGKLVGSTDGHISVGADGQMGVADGISASKISRKTSIRGHATRHTGDQVPNSGIQTQFRIEGQSMIGGIHSQTSPGHDNIALDGRASGILDSSASGKNVPSDSIISFGSPGQGIGSVRRTVDIQNQADITGAIGPAPKPEKKSSISIEGARISKKIPGSNTGKMKAATRSGFAISGDRTVSNNMNTGTRQSDKNMQQAVQSTFASDGMVVGQSGNAESVASGGIERSLAFGNVFTDLTVDGSQSNTITDKINAGLETNFAAQNVAFTDKQKPVETAGTSNVDMNMHSVGKIIATQPVIGLVQSGKRDILSSGKNEPPLTISSLKPNSNMQRIFLVRASRPNTVLLSNSAEGSNGGMTISESVQPDTGIVRTSAEKASSATGKTLLKEKTKLIETGKISPNNAAIKLSTSQRQDTTSSEHSIVPSEIGVNSLNPSPELDFALGGPGVDMITSEVIDPLRTQMVRSDGLIAGEHKLLPSGNTVTITEKNLDATSGHTSTKSGGAVMNDVDAFRNELVKNSLIQGGALPANQAALKTNAHTDVAASHASTAQSAGSSNIAGTNLLASNEIGGKTGATSLDQTVNELLIEAQRILSSTADITNAQTATDTAPAGSVVKAAAASSKTQDHSHAKPAASATAVQTGTLGHVDKQNTIPALSLEYLLGEPAKSLHGTEGTHGHHGHELSVGNTRSGGSAAKEHTMLSTAESMRNSSPEGRHDTSGITGVGTDASQHSAGFHSNVVSAGHMSHLTADSSSASKRHNVAPLSTTGDNTNRRSSLNIGHINNEQLASHTSARGADIGVDAHASLLSNLDILGPETGILFKGTGSRSASNVNQINTKSVPGTESVAGILSDIGMDTVFANTPRPDQGAASVDHLGDAGVANVIRQNAAIGTASSGASQLSGKNDITGGGSDFGRGALKSQQSVQSGSNKIESVLTGTATSNTPGGRSANTGSSIDIGADSRLGGNVIDFSSSSLSSKQSSAGTGLAQSQASTDVTDINLLSASQTLRQRHGIIPDHIVGVRGDLALTPFGSSSLDLSTGTSPIGASGNVNIKDTFSSSHKQVDQTVSSSSRRRRIIGRNNKVADVGQIRSMPSAASAMTDGAIIEQQVNSFNLDNIPSSAVIGAGVQMTADGGLTAGFGPRGRNMPGERIIGERRLTSRENTRADVTRGSIAERTPGSRSGSLRMVTDPRTGFQARIPTGERRSGNIRDSSMERASVQDRHSHRSDTAGSARQPVYFLDMSGSASSDTRMTDRTNVRGLPLSERGSSSSERRVMELRDHRRRLDTAGAGFESRIGDSTSLADTSMRIREGDLGMDSGRRTGASWGGAGFDLMRGSSGSAVDSGTRLRENDVRTDTSRRSGAELGGTGFDVRMGSSRSISGTGAVFRENGLRLDSRRRTGGDRAGTGFATIMRGVGSSSDTGMGFREGSVNSDSRRRMGSSRGVAGFDMRMGGSRSTVSTGTGFREGDFRVDAGRRTGGDRSRVPSDLRMEVSRSSEGTGIGFREGGLSRDSSRRIEGELRGARRGDIGRDGRRRSSRHEAVSRSSDGTSIGFREGGLSRDSSRRIEGELRAARRGDIGRDGRRRSFRHEVVPGGRMSSLRRPASPTGVPLGAPMASTGGSIGGAMTSVSGFPHGMTSFGGPFMGPGSIMGSSVPMSGLPFDDGFGSMSVGPDFGPSFGPVMEPPGMGPDIGMPFSPMEFGPPGML